MPAIPDHLLEPDEVLICRARVHWWYNLRSFGLRNLFEHTLVTDRRIVEKTGILSTQTRSLALAQIETRDVSQTIWGRVFGFGDVHIHGSGGQAMHLGDLARPAAVARAIGRAAADQRARSGSEHAEGSSRVPRQRPRQGAQGPEPEGSR